MYNTFIYQPILNGLLWLYGVTGNNLGLAIILLTLIVRGVLVPFTLPSLRSAQKISKIKPELDKLKKKYSKDSKDPKKLQAKTLELYKKHDINPASGCLPQIVQLVFLIALYRVFINSIGEGSINGSSIDTQFFIWDLKSKDTTYTLPILAGVLQLLTSLTLTPGVEDDPERRKSKEESKEDVAEMAQTMTQQMIFLMPALTVFMAIQFPSGLALYWTITTAFSFTQQLIISGPGGLRKYLAKVGIKI